MERAIASTERHGEELVSGGAHAHEGRIDAATIERSACHRGRGLFPDRDDIAREQAALFWELRISSALRHLRMTQAAMTR